MQPILDALADARQSCNDGFTAIPASHIEVLQVVQQGIDQLYTTVSLMKREIPDSFVEVDYTSAVKSHKRRKGDFDDLLATLSIKQNGIATGEDLYIYIFC